MSPSQTRPYLHPTFLRVRPPISWRVPNGTCWTCRQRSDRISGAKPTGWTWTLWAWKPNGNERTFEKCQTFTYSIDTRWDRDTHFFPQVQLPRHAVVREVRVGRRLQQLGRLPVLVLRRRLYPRLLAAVEFRRAAFAVGLVLFAVAVHHRVAVVVDRRRRRSRITEHVVLVVVPRDRLYGQRRSGAVLFPGSSQEDILWMTPFFFIFFFFWTDRLRTLIQ